MRTVLIASLALVLGACTWQPPAPQPQPSAMSPAVRSVITGVVSAPAQLVAAVLPTGGGNVVPTGGGNFGLLMAESQPLANARVFLADAAGQPYPALAPATTDAQGRYTFQDVPAGYSFMVVVQAHDTRTRKDVTLQTLARSSELGATAPVDVATSLVTVAVTEGQGGQLGEVNAAAFRTATEATAKNLADGDVPDLSDRGAILAKVEDLSKAVAELKSALDAIRQDLQDIKQSIDDLKDQIAAQQQQAPQPAPPPQQQPSQQQPPQGQAGMGPGNCLPPVTFEVVLQMPVDAPRYPLTLELRPTQDTPNPFFTATFETPGSTARLTAPPNCGHFLTLRGHAGQVVVATNTPWTPPPGAGDANHPKVTLPF